MQYKSCQWVNRGIEFRTNELRLCCYGYLQGRETEYQTTLLSDYHGGKIDWKAFFEKKMNLNKCIKKVNI